MQNLPIEYYEKHFLWSVRNSIGKTMKEDPNTLALVLDGGMDDFNVEQGKFTHISVEIDLKKKLVPKV